MLGMKASAPSLPVTWFTSRPLGEDGMVLGDGAWDSLGFLVVGVYGKLQDVKGETSMDRGKFMEHLDFL